MILFGVAVTVALPLPRCLSHAASPTLPIPRCLFLPLPLSPLPLPLPLPRAFVLTLRRSKGGREAPRTELEGGGAGTRAGVLWHVGPCVEKGVEGQLKNIVVVKADPVQFGLVSFFYWILR